jgi:predicted DNA-binding transcriptional regulator AlpA
MYFAMNNNVDPELLTAEQVAELLNVSPRRVAQMCDDGSIPEPCRLTVGLKNPRRWPASQIRDWIIDRCPAASTWTWDPARHERAAEHQTLARINDGIDRINRVAETLDEKLSRAGSDMELLSIPQRSP